MMQAKDIPDALVIAIVRDLGWYKRATCRFRDLWWSYWWDVQLTLEHYLPGVPAKVLEAKLRRLIARGLLTGCPCGCRGDYAPTAWGENVAEATPPLRVWRAYTKPGEVIERVVAEAAG